MAWNPVADLKGPQGEQGPQGEVGPEGDGVISSVNGQTGDVSLGVADLADFDGTGSSVGRLVAVTEVDGSGNATGFAAPAEVITDPLFHLVLAGDQSGGIGGNGTAGGDTDSTPHITIQSWQSPHGPNVGGFGQGLRLDVMDPLAKNLIVWRMPEDPTAAWDADSNPLQDVVWMGAHYRHTNPDNTPGDIGAHFHWSIEAPDSNGALQSRFQIKIGDPATGEIGLDRANVFVTNADLTVGADNGMLRIAAGGTGTAKVIEWSQFPDGVGKDWQLAVGGTADDLLLTRYLSDSNSFPVLFAQRLTGRIAIGQGTVEAGTAFCLNWGGGGGDRGFVAKPSVAIGTNAAFVALLQNTSDRAIDIRDAAGSTPRWEVSGTGVVAWGPGSSARDTNLYRKTTNQLATDDAFFLGDVSTPGAPTAGVVLYSVGGVLKVRTPAGDFTVDVTAAA